MSVLSIEVQVQPGASIEAACIDAMDAASHLRVPVWFKFNDYSCTVRPHHDDFEAKRRAGDMAKAVLNAMAHGRRGGAVHCQFGSWMVIYPYKSL